MNIKIIDSALLESLSQSATLNERKRINYNFHQYSDPAQRFLNAIEPESYIRPHRHVNPPKDEAFLVLKGRGAVIAFSDQGNITDIMLLDPHAGPFGVDIPGGIFHTIISLESGSVFYEVKPGPFDASHDKGFAEWAPEADSPEAAAYLQELIKHIRSVTER